MTHRDWIREGGDFPAYKAELHQFLSEGGYHLSEKELCCHDEIGTPYPESGWKDGTLDRLILMFEGFRSYLEDIPLVVTCAYRTPDHNEKVGGAAHSQHVLGRALDIATPKDFAFGVQEFHCLAIDYAGDYDGVGGLGLYDWDVHMDCRPRKENGDYAFWDFRSKS